MLNNPTRRLRSIVSVALFPVVVLVASMAGFDPAPALVATGASAPAAEHTQVAEARRAPKARKARAAKPRRVCTGKGRARRCSVVTPAPAPPAAPEAAPEAAPVASEAAAPAPAAPSGGDPGAFAFLFPNDGRPGRFNPCAVVHYKVNAHRAPAGGQADLAEAVSRISAATGITFAYDGLTDEMPQSAGGRYSGSTTIVAWAVPGESNLLTAGAAGVGGASAVLNPDGTIRITKGFVVLDATQHTSAGFGGGFSQGALLLHELGHMVGLHHVGDPAQIMYPTLTAGAPGDLGAGDRNGLAAVGATNGCLA